MALGKFATGHWKGVFFIIVGLCLGGIYAASSMPSSVFPQTNFPRVTLMIDNGEMPADEMMATITKPIEEAMKDVPGVESIRSNTGRGSSVAVSPFQRTIFDVVPWDPSTSDHIPGATNPVGGVNLEPIFGANGFACTNATAKADLKKYGFLSIPTCGITS